MKPRRRYLFWRVPVEAEVDEELAAHIELQTRRFVRDGMTPDAARARAMRRFGDPSTVRDECRDIRNDMENDMRQSEFREELRQDAVFAIRGFRRAPLFTLVALLTIAIGVGANTTIFSVLDTLLLRPLPYPNADRLFTLNNAYQGDALTKTAVSPPELFDYRETFRSLDAIAAFRPAAVTLTGAGDAEPIDALVVTPNLFEVLGEHAVLGRDFRPSDGRPDEAQVALLSDALWRRRFGRDSAIIGRQVMINDIPRTVIGVMRPGLRFPDSPVGYASARADVWIANTLETSRAPGQRGNQNLVVIGLRNAHASSGAIARDMAATIARFKREYPDRYDGPRSGGWTMVSGTLRDDMVGSIRAELFMFTAAVAIVLLIACANVANLLLARTALRQREIAVRRALGASRFRLLRQLVTESMILSLAGGALGAGFAAIAVKALRAYGVVEIPQLDAIRMDFNVLAYTFALSALAGALIGLVPGLQSSSARPGTLRGEGGRGASGGLSGRRLRTALVVAQVGMALVVLDTAGLLARSFMALEHVEPGFQPAGVMSAYVSLPRRAGGAYDSVQKVNAFYQRLLDGVSALPGVTSAGGIYPLPVSDDRWSGSFDVEGYPAAQEPPHAEYAAAMPGYFRTMGIPLRGRDFSADDGVGRPLTAIVDEDLARRYWPGQDAIGKRVSQDASTGRWMTVIGVVGHVHRDGPAKVGEPQLYLPYLQHPQGMLYAVARTSAPPLTLAGPMRQVVRSLDRDVPVSKQRAVSELLHESIARERFNLSLTALFAIAALALASIGLYGVMSYLVAQRTREIGIRVALGGRPGDVRRMVMRESLAIALVGLVLGTAGSLALSRGLTRFLFGIEATDPVTYGSIAALLVLVACLAAFGPARRATRIDPLVALRDS